eukprot:365450-Chlamydomonas_euryale.AAC.6
MPPLRWLGYGRRPAGARHGSASASPCPFRLLPSRLLKLWSSAGDDGGGQRSVGGRIGDGIGGELRHRLYGRRACAGGRMAAMHTAACGAVIRRGRRGLLGEAGGCSCMRNQRLRPTSRASRSALRAPCGVHAKRTPPGDGAGGAQHGGGGEVHTEVHAEVHAAEMPASAEAPAAPPQLVVLERSVSPRGAGLAGPSLAVGCRVLVWPSRRDMH